MRFLNSATVGGALAAGAGLAAAQDVCSDRSTIVVTQYVTLPSSTPAASTPVYSSVKEITSAVTLTPVPVNTPNTPAYSPSSPAVNTPNTPAVNTPNTPAYTPSSPAVNTPSTPASSPSAPLTTSTFYTTSHDGTTLVTVLDTTTICPVTASEASASSSVVAPSSTVTPVETPVGTPVGTPVETPVGTPAVTPSVQYTTSTIYTTSQTVDSTGGTKIVTVPHTTTVCPVTASEAAATSSSCTSTSTVTVGNPETVTFTYTSTPAAASVPSSSVQALSSAPVVTPSAQYFTSTIFTTSHTVDSTGGTKIITVPHTTTVCPVTASEAAAAASSSDPSSNVDALASTPAVAPQVSTPAYSPAYTPAYSPVYTPSTPAVIPSAAADPSNPAAFSAVTPSLSSTFIAETLAQTSTQILAESSVAASTPSLSSTFIAETTAITSTQVLAASTASSAASASSTASSDSLLDGLTELTSAVTGVATYFEGDVSAGACGFTGYTLPSSIFGAALSYKNWDTAANCGSCARVTGPSGNAITAMIVDKCPDGDCDTNHLDLFEDAFETLAELAIGVIDITWEYVSCGFSEPLTLLNKDGASEYWFAMQVQNSNLPIAKLEVSIDDGSTWTETTRSDYNYFIHDSGFGTDIVDIRITASTGKTVTQKNVSTTSGLSITADLNF